VCGATSSIGGGPTSDTPAVEGLMRIRLSRDLVNDALVERVKVLSGQKLGACYQCGKCSAGCPVVEEMDIVPSEAIRFLQLGQAEHVLGSRTIWVCASCLQCASRCPKGVEFSSICDALRVIVLRRRLSNPKKDADELSAAMKSDAPQMGVVGALRKLNG
jgi:heterodisulfide reductase subunit C